MKPFLSGITLWKNSFRSAAGAVIEMSGLQCEIRRRSEILHRPTGRRPRRLNVPAEDKTSAAGEISSD